MSFVPPQKDAILNHFSQFFTKLVQNHPLKDELLENFSNFQQVITHDSSNYLQTKSFISTLHQRNLSKTPSDQTKPSQGSLQTSESLSSDSSLKQFSSESVKYPFSLLAKFTYASFRDYLAKNSISLPIDSPLIYKYSHIREFLPDSQNFYRALGLGLLEILLSDAIYVHRIGEWYQKVFHREILLTTQIYPFSSDEMRSTFCGYLKQLLQSREDPEETREGKISRNLLYQMTTKDTVFDVALISFIKELLISKLKPSETLEDQIRSNDSNIIEDLILEIPQVFSVNLIVQIIQGKSVCENIYTVQGSDPKVCPTLHILNEKQFSYQNFCILNLDNLESETFQYQKPLISHNRNHSLQREKTTNLEIKPERNFNTEFKASSDKLNKGNKPPHAQAKKITAFEETDYAGGFKSVFDKSSNEIKSHPLRYLTEGNGIQSDEDDEESRFVFNEESPKTDVISLSKILNGYMGMKPKPQKENKSPTKHTSAMHSRQGSYLADLSYLDNKDTKPMTIATPPKAQIQLTTENSGSPFNFNISPLTLNLTPATQLQEQTIATKTGTVHAFAEDENITSQPRPILNPMGENQSVGVLQPRVNNIDNKTNNIARTSELKALLKPSFPQTRTDFEFQKPKIITMVPKFMSNVPANPFSAGFNMNPMSGMPPSGLQLHEYSSSAKTGLRSEEDTTGPSRRFSLNPLSFLGHNVDQLDKRLGIKEGTGKNLRSSGQRGDLTENYGTIADRRASYGVPVNQNMSAGFYGQGISERKMYQY